MLAFETLLDDLPSKKFSLSLKVTATPAVSSRIWS